MGESEQTGDIYIVDDDPAVRDLLSEVFTEAGFRPVSFVDGASFLAAARKRMPACVILDIYMPGRSGLEVLRDLDAANYPAPIFIASGRGDIPSAIEAVKNGAFEQAVVNAQGGEGGAEDVVQAHRSPDSVA